MSEPRKHHYLPQFYLRGFSRNGRGLYQIEKATQRPIGCAISGVAAIRDYHRWDDDGTPDQYALEKSLSKVEDILASALAEVVERREMGRTQHARMIELLSLLRMRIPAMKESIEASLIAMLKTTAIMMERHGQLPPPPPGYEEQCKAANLKYEVSNWKVLKHMFKLASAEELLNKYYSMSPTLVIAPDGAAFVTSDQPVAVYNPKAKHSDHYGANIIDPLSEITLPLSERLLLLLTWREKYDQVATASIEDVSEYNRRVVIMARSYVFSSTNEQSVLDLVGRHATHFAGPEEPAVIDMGSTAFQIQVNRPVMPAEQYVAG